MGAHRLIPACLGVQTRFCKQLGNMASNRVARFGYGRAILHDAVGKFKEKWA